MPGLRDAPGGRLARGEKYVEKVYGVCGFRFNRTGRARRRKFDSDTDLLKGVSGRMEALVRGRNADKR
jgi:hypothetical protein